MDEPRPPFGSTPAQGRAVGPGHDQADSQHVASAPPVVAAQLSARVVYAGIWRRIWALLMDLLLLWALSSLLIRAGGWTDEGATSAVLGLFLFYLVVGTVIGGSIGKRMLGLRVVRADNGLPLGLFAAFLRELARVPSVLLVFGALWMLDHPRRQALHDIAGGSVVVRELPLLISPSWATRVPWERQADAPGQGVVRQ